MADNYNNLVYNEERLQDAQALIEEIKNDLYDADSLLYDAVMKIAYATGFEHIELDDSAIDMRMPEKLMVQCRDETKTISESIHNQLQLIQDYVGGKTSTQQRTDIINEDVASHEVSEPAQPLYGPPPSPDTGISTTPQLLYGPPPSPDTGISTTPQLLYGAPPSPTTGAMTTPQVVYGPAPITGAVTTPQALYGPAPQPDAPTYTITIPTQTTPQVIYGPAPTTGVMTTPQVVYGPAPITSVITTPQVVYGPAQTPQTYTITLPSQTTTPPVVPSQSVTTPVSSSQSVTPPVVSSNTIPTVVPDTQPRVDTPSTSGVGGHDPIPATVENLEQVSVGGDATSLLSQYSAIPQTSTQNQKDGVSNYIAPAAIGAAAGFAGVAAIRRRKRKKEEEQFE